MVILFTKSWMCVVESLFFTKQVRSHYMLILYFFIHFTDRPQILLFSVHMTTRCCYKFHLQSLHFGINKKCHRYINSFFFSINKNSFFISSWFFQGFARSKNISNFFSWTPTLLFQSITSRFLNQLFLWTIFTNANISPWPACRSSGLILSYWSFSYLKISFCPLEIV